MTSARGKRARPGPQDGACGPVDSDPQQRLLGPALGVDRSDLSGLVGTTTASARRFWQALGLPRVGTQEVVFTEADVSALRTMVDLVRSGRVDEPTAIAFTRLMARGAARLADAQGQLASEMLEGAQQDAAQLLMELAEPLEELVVYTWRRHLAVAVAQLAAQAGETPDDREHIRTVGFADMVGFTRIVSRLTEHELGALVARFEGIAADTIASYGGHLVKTIGDGVLFSAREPRDAAGIALTLIDTLTADPDFPSLRVGLATGAVLVRLGDLYGTPVNLAARLTEVARPGTVVVDDRVASALVGDPALLIRSLWPRTLRGFGTTRMAVARSGPDGPPVPRRAPR